MTCNKVATLTILSCAGNCLYITGLRGVEIYSEKKIVSYPYSLESLKNVTLKAKMNKSDNERIKYF